MSSGIDLALALVNADHGAAAATDVARHLVVYVTRPGGQSQFSTSLTAQAPVDSSMRELQGWIEDNLQSDLSLPVLADRAHLSVRQFSRAFRAATGIAPAAYVSRVRLDAARRLLEQADVSVAEAAYQSGFASVEVLDRTFRRVLGITPREYRERISGRR